LRAAGAGQATASSDTRFVPVKLQSQPQPERGAE
jgi:hypothetical protein